MNLPSKNIQLNAILLLFKTMLIRCLSKRLVSLYVILYITQFYATLLKSGENLSHEYVICNNVRYSITTLIPVDKL